MIFLGPGRNTRFLVAIFVWVSFWASFASAHEVAPAANGGLRLQFVPPPMEGTISLGVYNGTGNLIRTLHKEASLDQFTADLDGLVTFWDGKDDNGNPAPAGRYEAKGFVVAESHFEGEAFHCNDWIDQENSPRIKRILDIRPGPGQELVLQAETTGIPGSTWWIFNGTALNGTSAPTNPKQPLTVGTAEGESVVDASEGSNHCIWAIVKGTYSCQVRQFSAEGEFLRQMPVDANAPQPVKIAASLSADQFYLLEEDASGQRVRGLALAESPSPSAEGVNSSIWKVTFSKSILPSDSLEKLNLQLSTGKPFEPKETVELTLPPNPLLNNQPSKLLVKAGCDSHGSFLATKDGLILQTITDTPFLRWTAISQDPSSKALVLLQSDGSVVEEFVAPKAPQIMAFDCGDFDFAPPKP